MKILHINTEKGWRGGEQQLFYLCKNLYEKGIEAAVACKIGSELEKRCKKEGIKTFPLSGNQLIDILRIGIIGKNFEIVHAHTAKAHNIAAFSKKFHKRPVIYTRRVSYPPKRNPLTKYKYALTEVTVAVSKKVARVLKENLRITENKLQVIYSSVDTTIEKLVDPQKVRKIRQELGGYPIVGTVAALTKEKNIPNFIKAAKIVEKKYPKAVFVVVGEGKLKNELQTLIKSLKLNDRFFLLGFKKDVYNYIKSFDLFILPSDIEGFSGSILNAMLLKVPVVVTNVGGAEEAVINGKTGILVPRRNPQALAKGISAVLEDESLRKRIISTAFEYVVKNFSVGRMVDAYTQLYGEVVSGRGVVGKVP